MAEPMFIRELIQGVMRGTIRIPSFQRGFVWDADRVAHLMDSIYKGFPFGTLLFWRTKTALSTERDLGPYRLPPNDPDYPIDYILDGQQRATSIFGVFQSELAALPNEDHTVFDIYFDLSQHANVQDSNFVHVPEGEMDPEKHFPLRLLFDPPRYRQFLRTMPDKIADKVDNLYHTFTTARIPIQTFGTDDRTAVAIVFERINRLGVELDTLQLLSAWTWNEEFDLQEKFSDLADDLGPYGFHDVGADSDLLLKCCAAIIAGEASAQAIVNLNGVEVRERFDEIRKGIFGAIDFLRNALSAYSAKVLPFPSIIIPLAVYFATPNEQDTYPPAEAHRRMVQWVWRAFFSRRYSKRLEQLNEDIREIRKLRCGQESRLGDFDVDLSETFFTTSQFNLRAANTKTFVLMLASEGPRNFVNGSPVPLEPVLRECNRKEFHHIFPRKFLSEARVPSKEINSLVNFAVLSRADNNILGGGPPSAYRDKMPEDNALVRTILDRAFCPNEMFKDDYGQFVQERAKRLVQKARELMGTDRR